jgi:predicted TIM-barrel fold metal-dependent hydrolase
VRGLQISAVPDGGPDAAQLRDIARSIVPFGQRIQLLIPLDVLVKARPLLATLSTENVINHMGAPGPVTSTHPHASTLPRRLDGGRIWLKRRGTYSSSGENAPWSNTGCLAHMFVACRPVLLRCQATTTFWTRLHNGPDPQTLQNVDLDSPTALHSFQRPS